MRALFVTLSFLVLFCSGSIAQLSVSNQGALISLKNGAFVSVHGDYRSELNGSFDNEDTVFLFGDWINNAGNTGFNEPDEGTVVFTGDTQRIMGTDVTHYYNLDHRATGVKFGDLDVVVDGVMQLNDREFNMDTNVVEVTNTDLAAVLNDGEGFVSSLEDGGLSRHTDKADEYFYPVGASQPLLRYRPVAITPSIAQTGKYKVRMANIDPTIEAYDRGVREPTICEINVFYHRIFRETGNIPADIEIFYDELADGPWANIAHWQSIPQWENVGPVSYNPGALSSLKVDDWDDYSYSPFALANATVPFDLEDVSAICKGDSVFLVAENGFLSYEFFVNEESVANSDSNVLIISNLSDGDSIVVVAQDTTCIAYSNPIKLTVHPTPIVDAGNDTTVYIGASVQLDGAGALYYTWTPDSSLDCSTCEDPLATVFETTPYVVIGYNEFDCKTSDTVVVIVDEEIDPRDILFIPNAFTPNGDGVNEVWNIRNIELFRNHQIIVVNRWGDVMYDLSPYSEPWDGTYNGKPVPDGTYYYLIQLKGVNQTLNGPLTVIH